MAPLLTDIIWSHVTESRHFLDWSNTIAELRVYLIIHISFGDLNSTATTFAGISCIWCMVALHRAVTPGVIGMRVSPGIVFPAHISLGMRVSPHIYH